MKTLHIVAGLLALFAGAIALYAAKGSPLHRKSGVIFVIAMLIMTSSAVFLATFIKPDRVNVLAGVLTFYLVATAFLTVQRSYAGNRTIIAGFMLVGFATAAYAFHLAFLALASPGGSVDGIPAPPIFMFAIVGTIAATLDAHLLWKGSISGKHRLARHLWRMSYAMWIATTSFFLGQAQIFPEPLRRISLLAIPVLIVTLLLFYWLIRTLWKRELPLPR